eukprot:COSAG02_NODE_4026_length_5886_cov_15.949542_3_plen_252_part_00
MGIEVEGVQAARAFRAFRIALVLKGPFGNSLRSLFGTLVMSVQPCINICLLLVLHFSLFAILGMQLFAPVGSNKPEDWSTNLTRLEELGQVQQSQLSNFHSFSAAMRLLFECISGKDWKVVMYEVDSYSSLAFWFFFLHYFIAVFILQNLFIGKCNRDAFATCIIVANPICLDTAIMVDAYTKTEREQSLDITKENMQVFQQVWQATAIKHGYKSTHWIERSHIKQFLIDVGAFKGSAAPAVAKGALYPCV